MASTRVAHTEFYINGEYKGLYINVEHINDDFLKLRFGNDQGNLYKCGWPADLHYISDNPNDYKMENNGERVYELKTKKQREVGTLRDRFGFLFWLWWLGFQQGVPARRPRHTEHRKKSTAKDCN